MVESGVSGSERMTWSGEMVRGIWASVVSEDAVVPRGTDPG